MIVINSRSGRYVVGLCLMLALVVSACGSSSSTKSQAAVAQAAPQSNTNLTWEKITGGGFTTPTKSGANYTVDVGNGETLRWKVGTKPNIAFFEQGTSNAYVQAEIKGANDAAKALGAKVTVFDAQFQPATQRSQIQNAIASGKYNAAVIIPLESQGSCTQVTKDLPHANIPVVVIAQETCGRDSTVGGAAWSPGIVSWVGNEWVPYFQGWANYVSRQITKHTQAIVINGPAALADVNIAGAEAKAAAAKNPNFDLVASVNTDFTTGQALTDTQNLLRAHPNVRTILLVYGGQIQGVVSAVAQAGLTGKVKIYDGSGGSAVEKTAIKQGQLEATVDSYPDTQAYCAVSMLGALYQGHKVPRVVPTDCHPAAGSPDTQHAVIHTPTNVASFSPEY